MYMYMYTCNCIMYMYVTIQHQNSWREGELQVGHQQTEMREKDKKSVLKKYEKKLLKPCSAAEIPSKD